MLTQFATINAIPTERSDEGSQNVAKKKDISHAVDIIEKQKNTSL